LTNARTRSEFNKRMHAYNRGYMAYHRPGSANPYHPKFEPGELKSWCIGWDDAAANAANGIADNGEWIGSGPDRDEFIHEAYEAMELKR